MKRITAILLVLAMLLGLAACGGPKPEDTVKAFCEGMKSFDLDAMQACTVEKMDVSEMFGEWSEMTADDEAFLDYIKSNAGEITYKIGSPNVSGDTASVSVDFQYKDISPVISEIYTEMFTQMFELLFGESSEDEVGAALDGILQDKITTVEKTDGAETAVFNLVKQDKEWKITALPEAANKVLTGNMEAGADVLDELLNSEDMDWDMGDNYEPIEYPISDAVLFDTEDAKMTLVSGKRDEWGDNLFHIVCENKTKDKSLYFDVDYLIVNGWYVTSTFGQTVAPESSLEGDLSIWASDLEAAGIELPDRMEMGVRVFDEDSWLTSDDDYTVLDTFTVYPTGLTDAQITVPARPAGDKEMVIADNDDFTFIIIGENDDAFEGMAGSLRVYMKNKTDKRLYFSWEDVSINGIGAEPYFGCTIPSGRQAVDDLSFDTSGFSEGYVPEYEKVEFTLVVRDNDDWDAEDMMKESFVYEP